MPTRSDYSRKITFSSEGGFCQIVVGKKRPLQKFLNFLEGDRYEGNWSILEGVLTLNYTNIPKAGLNLDLPFVKVPIANWINHAMEAFQNHEYKIEAFDEATITLFSVEKKQKETWQKLPT
jgi:hypothetical protein